MNDTTKDEQKIIIAGSRTFNNYDFVSKLLNTLDFSDAIIVSGHASGVDSLGERYANEHEIELKVFPADWNKYGKSAGPIRNRQMAEYADVLILFWDGESRGSKNMLETAKKFNLEIHEVII